MTVQLDVQGRRTVEFWTNQTGGLCAYGSVVVIDTAHDESFTTDTAGAFVGAVGVVVEVNGIAAGAQGRVCVEGHVEQVNLDSAGTRGHFIKTHTVAKQATDAGASRVLGVFGQLETSGSTPKATLFGMPDGVTGAGGLSGGTPALTLGTSNAAGSAGSGIRTDATIALFDATAPSTQASADAAAAGSAGVAARRDHKHGFPTLKTRTRVLTLVVSNGASAFFNDADLARIGGAILVQDGNSLSPAMISFYRNGSFNGLLGVGSASWEFRGGTFSGGSVAASVFLESNSAGARVGIKNNLGFDTDFLLFDWTVAGDLA